MAIVDYAFPPAKPIRLASGKMPARVCQCQLQVETKAAAAGEASVMRADSTGVPWHATACLTLKIIWN